jgi:hypothetical protein
MWVEASLVWPTGRDEDPEGVILASIRPLETGAEVRPWQAAGISLTLNSEFELQDADTQVGRVRWTFARGGKLGPWLTVERLAMPEMWLTGPLGDWMVRDLPPGHHVVRQESRTINVHDGQQVLSQRRLGAVYRLRGLEDVRLTAAWLCPAEGRVYRVSLGEMRRNREIRLPEDLRIRCCRHVLAVVEKRGSP